MPRISAASNAAQRAETQRRILTAFGELLFTHGLPGLTMTDVARHARIGRTAVYNYYADIEELLIAYALDETERFLIDCGIPGRAGEPGGPAGPVRARPGGGPQPAPPAAGPAMGRCSRRRPSPSWRTMWASSACCCRASCATAWPRATCPRRTSPSSPSSSTAPLLQRRPRRRGRPGRRGGGAAARTVRFIQLGAGGQVRRRRPSPPRGRFLTPVSPGGTCG